MVLPRQLVADGSQMIALPLPDARSGGRSMGVAKGQGAFHLYAFTLFHPLSKAIGYSISVNHRILERRCSTEQRSD